MYKKVVLISRLEPSSWKSCQSIVSNLSKAYSQVFRDSELIHLHVQDEFNSYQAHKAVRKIQAIGPELIVWIDHAPSPALLLSALMRFYQGANKPKLLIHLFGDFVLDCLKWQDIADELNQWPIHFVAASDRQRELVRKLTSMAQISCLPFPVDTDFFSGSSLNENRDEIRKKLKISEDERVLLYTGRVSYQKNVELLIKVFGSLEKMCAEKIRLWIAGPVDDILVPYMGKHGLPGSYFMHLSYSTNLLQEKVHYLGNCSAEQLLKYYHAADIFVSPSTYNDEDFGMSPAEAICTGLPSVLSDWGGYTSFKKYSSEVELVPVHLIGDRPVVDGKRLQKALIHFIFRDNITAEQRALLSEQAKKSLSIDAVAEQLKNSLPGLKFDTVIFSKIFVEMCRCFRNDNSAPFRDTVLYRNIYSDYCD